MDYVNDLKNKEIPNKSTVKTILAKPKKSLQTTYNNSIVVNGNNNNFYGSKDSSGSSSAIPKRMRETEEEDSSENSRKKQNNNISEKESEEDTSSNEKGNLWKEWVFFLSNPDNIQKFYPYSPEYHDIIRCGKGVSWKPNLSNELYQRHIKLHEDAAHTPLPSTVLSYIATVTSSVNINEFKRNIRQLPDGEESVVDFLEDVLRSCYSMYNTAQDIAGGEAMFNDILLFPFLKAVCVGAANTGTPQFKVGETQLKSMSKKKMDNSDEDDSSSDESTTYKADGIISLHALNKLEVLLLETSNNFGNTDSSKHSFDHHKGLYGALSTLKAIADNYSYGSLETFAKVKVYFVHVAEKNVRLWSLKYIREGPAYELWLEESCTLNTSFEERSEQVPFIIKFYWSMKCLIGSTAANIAALKQEHTRVVGEQLFSSSLPENNLATTITCSMLKLTEEGDKSGMFRLF